MTWAMFIFLSRFFSSCFYWCFEFLALAKTETEKGGSMRSIELYNAIQYNKKNGKKSSEIACKFGSSLDPFACCCFKKKRADYFQWSIIFKVNTSCSSAATAMTAAV